MVSGFLGTLIGLERAVALEQRKFYLGPILTGLGSLWLVIGLPIQGGQVMMVLGSLGLTAVSLHIIRQHKTNYTVIMGLGALCWLVGNSLWLFGWPIFQFVYWWAGFLILTIVGERLELNRVQRLAKGSLQWFTAAVGFFLAGLLISLGWPVIGTRLASLGVIALALWLLRYDIARRTVRKSGATRYIGLNLMAGYSWLLVGGIAGLVWGQLAAGLHYDLWLHALFLGFAFGMIFAHALLILPAITGISLTYHPVFYLPTFLLQFSLLLRFIGDLTGTTWRQWGGLLNGVAILLFFLLVGASLVKSRGLRP
jgi:hypothetical protein